MTPLLRPASLLAIVALLVVAPLLVAIAVAVRVSMEPRSPFASSAADAPELRSRW